MLQLIWDEATTVEIPNREMLMYRPGVNWLSLSQALRGLRRECGGRVYEQFRYEDPVTICTVLGVKSERVEVVL